LLREYPPYAEFASTPLTLSLLLELFSRGELANAEGDTGSNDQAAMALLGEIFDSPAHGAQSSRAGSINFHSRYAYMGRAALCNVGARCTATCHTAPQSSTARPTDTSHLRPPQLCLSHLLDRSSAVRRLSAHSRVAAAAFDKKWSEEQAALTVRSGWALLEELAWCMHTQGRREWQAADVQGLGEGALILWSAVDPTLPFYLPCYGPLT